MSYIHRYNNIYSYFAKQLGESHDWWRNKIVLDFGGNRSNILSDINNTIQHRNYYCLDVSETAINCGRTLYPDANWYHYNRYNHVYNPSGNRDELFPIFDTKFDVILSYAVFSSTSIEEMETCVNTELLPLLKKDGILMFTYISTDDSMCLDYFLRERKNDNEEIDTIKTCVNNLGYFYLVGKNMIYQNFEQVPENSSKPLLTFYKNDIIHNMFPRAEINPPFRRISQNCVIIRNAT